ncbi:glycoside hydrolase family 12 protein [Podospora conica]|nr:glycoside hydrolase family 12 protein [Schizothecium conicum]
MKATTLLALLPSLALASPAASLAPRQQRGAIKQLCGQYDYWSNDQYEANNNLWGKGSAQAGGSQCTYIDSVSGSNVAWSSTWTWQGGPDNVKSYVYVGRKVTRGRKISQISSMPTAITWKYDNYNNMRANVAYDIFTSADANRDNTAGDYELMIWLARIGGVYPIGQNSGQVNVGGRQWELWIGYNGAMKVFSFVPPNSGTINSWSGDAKVFFNHLTERQNFPASQQNLIVFQVGTEAFTGSNAVFSVSSFNAAIN